MESSVGHSVIVVVGVYVEALVTHVASLEITELRARVACIENVMNGLFLMSNMVVAFMKILLEIAKRQDKESACQTFCKMQMVSLCAPTEPEAIDLLEQGRNLTVEVQRITPLLDRSNL